MGMTAEERKAYKAAYYQAHKGAQAAWAKAYYQQNKEEIRRRQKAYYAAHPDKQQARGRKDRARPGHQQRRTARARLRNGNPPLYPCPNHCELCGAAFRDSRDQNSDHDHSTLKWRGWLCSACNRFEGLYKKFKSEGLLSKFDAWQKRGLTPTYALG